MIIKTMQQPWVVCRSANSTDASFTDKVVTATQPTGIGVVMMAAKASGNGDISLNTNDGAVVPNSLLLKPYGVGADDTTFLMRVWHWAVTNGANPIWIPTVLIEVTCTLSTKVGVAGKDVDNTNRFCDLIVATTNYGTVGIDYEVLSPGNNDPGHIILDIKGATEIEITFNMNSSATSANCLIGRI